MVGFAKDKSGNAVHELDYNLIGSRIKQIREENNLTQNDIAKVLNTDHQAISCYEFRLIPTDFAYSLCKEYKVLLDWLCGRTNKENDDSLLFN